MFRRYLTCILILRLGYFFMWILLFFTAFRILKEILLMRFTTSSKFSTIHLNRYLERYAFNRPKAFCVMGFFFVQVGAAYPVDIIKFDAEKGFCILRCFLVHSVRVRAALTLSNQCIFHTKRATNNLLSLLSNSREFRHTQKHVVLS